MQQSRTRTSSRTILWRPKAAEQRERNLRQNQHKGLRLFRGLRVCLASAYVQGNVVGADLRAGRSSQDEDAILDGQLGDLPLPVPIVRTDLSALEQATRR